MCLCVDALKFVCLCMLYIDDGNSGTQLLSCAPVLLVQSDIKTPSQRWQSHGFPLKSLPNLNMLSWRWQESLSRRVLSFTCSHPKQWS